MSKKKKQPPFIKAVVLIALCAWMLSGCAYPRGQMIQNTAPPVQQIKMVQDAVDQFQKETGVLPIMTRNADTPEFERYPVDFSKIMPKYIPYIPGAAFEVGGNYMFVLLDAETKPEVRLIDLTVSQGVQTMQEKVSRYFADKKEFPFGQKVADGYYLIDFDKLRMGEETILSHFSEQPMSYIINERGQVGVDYAMDLAMALKNAPQKPNQNEDIRRVLTDVSPLAPVKSFPYHLVDGEPKPVFEN
ncbi:hypothetical protein [Aneurinibacillus migulanus]|uniref:Lipoprotein n=1 Tax=Aneurinibacillus migulanus TaxID=47500 RepID=A0A0K2WGU0_ANEMI|nr:hypothetical protein [Aneurinibacillus migulanus]MCP1354179.1 hypothetical protein [Aneurinibacillus migulanus]MED0891266.1 hypothetical protein [Aneurinibacillus migulanus]MED1614046.1 hypothetical protein [Aneurinibacillus migulanus]CEH30004.1 Uncharacterized protein BN1090_A2_02444 [Aneurinibacillus migulanus]SDI01063.1 hypothetical protein SAMN04487909_101231 [Aneurinibacillus migulanus]